jgi:hypothetical protein
MILNHARVAVRVKAGFKRLQAGGSYSRGFARGIVKSAELLLKESRKVVPIDTGALYESSKVVESGRNWSKQATVEYRMPYALYVHEDPVPKHKPGKTYKYLENPLKLNKEKMRKILVAEARKP